MIFMCALNAVVCCAFRLSIRNIRPSSQNWQPMQTGSRLCWRWERVRRNYAVN